jgi:hypothetical protein
MNHIQKIADGSGVAGMTDSSSLFSLTRPDFCLQFMC